MKIRCIALSFLMTLWIGAAFGQEPAQQASGLDISGNWFNAATQGGGQTPLVDYGGVPVSDAGRLYGLAWSASRLTVRQQQCTGYTPPYMLHGGGNFRFWEERDPVTQRLISIRMYGQITEGHRTIWMDGRAHPPAYAQHTWMGFSTGRFEGPALNVYTSHIKRGWILHDGVPQSDQATYVEHFVRHGDYLTYTSVITDPIYLAEPLVRTAVMVRAVRDPEAWLYACDDGEEIQARSDGRVPYYSWGQHPFLREYSEKFKVPLLGALGGSDTIYPEYRAKIKNMDAAAVEAVVKVRIVPTTGQGNASRAVNPDPHDGEIHVWPVQGNVYLLIGDGANIAVQIGDERPLVVDTGAGQLTEKVVAAIRKLSDKPVQFIANTSFHSDHVGGNVKVRAAGEDPSVMGSFFSSQFADAGKGATIIAHQNVQNRMSASTSTGKANPTPSEGWPTDTFFEGRRRKFFNGEGVEIFYEPNAITDGDTIIQFRRSDVIVTGDIFNSTQYPVIDLPAGGSFQGEIDALNNILDKTIYKHQEEGGTLVIPGHGRICDEYEVSEYRDMLVIIRDRVQTMIENGATKEQVVTARVSADYDDRYGALSGPWTTEMFVTAVYESLKQHPAKSGRN